ncbi:aspartate/glutamate racemase family protein [Bosea sp. Root381]|uniref:aspartate/glutamate racemase family protein n=1 Tax=Bosea sp. Root381 TaxID=1736524 RepID=UPI000A574AA6|nr:aspartate/glutamate racemase family protein [Bosea sp. Root381]
MRIALINPNTTASMTRKMASAAVAVAAPSSEIVAITAATGPASIEGYYDEALAVPGLLAELRKSEAAGADAAIIGCFDDTGLDAARAMAGIPVLGLCESALSLASLVAKRITIVTTDLRARVPVEELVGRYGMAGKVRVRATGSPVLALEDPRSPAVSRLKAEIALALEADHAEAIVLGCAGMADLAQSLLQEFGVPVIDGVGAAVKQAEALVTLRLTTSKRGAYSFPAPKAFRGYPAGQHG